MDKKTWRERRRCGAVRVSGPAAGGATAFRVECLTVRNVSEARARRSCVCRADRCKFATMFARTSWRSARASSVCVCIIWSSVGVDWRDGTSLHSAYALIDLVFVIPVSLVSFTRRSRRESSLLINIKFNLTLTELLVFTVYTSLSGSINYNYFLRINCLSFQHSRALTNFTHLLEQGDIWRWIFSRHGLNPKANMFLF